MRLVTPGPDLDRRALLRGAAAALALAALPTRRVAAQPPPPRPPNFLLILCDDLGWGDLEAHGAPIQMPATTQLARQGVDATDYYSPGNLGTPARAGILTGRYPFELGLAADITAANDQRVLARAETTLASALAPTYASALIGEWRLGHTGPDWLPTRHGFDLFYGIPYGHDLQPLELYDASAASASPTTAPADPANLQQQFRTRAEAFIDANQKRPFLLVLALSIPHVPAHPNASFAGKSEQGAYGDVLMELDSIVGRLVAKLQALHLERDTLVILTSSNGAGFEGSNGPARGRKGDAGYDGGYRVPFIANCPGLVKPGKTDALISGLDLLPTFVSLAGLSLPPGLALDGIDVSHALTRGVPAGHEEILLFDGDDVMALRTQQWKYVERTSFRGQATSYADQGLDELYDMIRDRSESFSVASMNPYVVQDMKRRLARAKAKLAR